MSGAGHEIPDRIKEGYGPNLAALLKLRDEGASVVVTVDCGTTAHEPLAAAASAGIDVVIIDHHATEPKLPDAFAVVNPNRLDESSPHRQLAAVGVAFLLAVAVNRALRREGWYESRPEPDLLDLLDLVALGTVCDVVPLESTVIWPETMSAMNSCTGSKPELIDAMRRRLSGIHENTGVPAEGGNVVSKIRRGGSLASGGYGSSHVSSPRPAFRESRSCFPSGENRTLGAFTNESASNGAGS